jgi:beta-N-acetylhexosaminidase
MSESILSIVLFLIGHLQGARGLPVVNRSRDQLYSTELAQYTFFVQSHTKLDNPGMIMTTYALMPALDPNMPAELSRTIVTDTLRHQLDMMALS